MAREQQAFIPEIHEMIEWSRDFDEKPAVDLNLTKARLYL